MMDIENLRKIQETEKMLRIYNITDAPRDAIDSVRGDVMVGGHRVPEFESRDVQKTEQKREVTTMDSQLVDELKKQVSEQGEFISRQAKLIYELQTVVNDIIKEVKKIQGSIPTKNPSERQVVLKPEEKKEHPRSGGFTPDDVSIDKIFYAGGR